MKFFMMLTRDHKHVLLFGICMGFGGEQSVKVTNELSSLSVP